MAADTVDFADKNSGEYLFATEINDIKAAINGHAKMLDLLVQQLASKLDAQGVADALAAAGKPLVELVLPMMVRQGLWYTEGTGIWEARRTFSASAAPTAGPNWRLVASFTGSYAPAVSAAGISDATAAGRALLTAADAAAQLKLLDKLDITANEYGTTRPSRRPTASLAVPTISLNSC